MRPYYVKMVNAGIYNVIDSRVEGEDYVIAVCYSEPEARRIARLLNEDDKKG